MNKPVDKGKTSVSDFVRSWWTVAFGAVTVVFTLGVLYQQHMAHAAEPWHKGAGERLAVIERKDLAALRERLAVDEAHLRRFDQDMAELKGELKEARAVEQAHFEAIMEELRK